MMMCIGLLWPGYSVSSNVPSELSAIGAPTRPLWISLGIVYAALLVAFGWSLWTSRGNRALRIAGALIITQTVFGQFWPPMHQRSVLAAGGGTLTDTLHLVWAAVSGVFFTLTLGFAAAALGRRFRIYSILTVAGMIGCGVVTGTYASRLQADLPTPGAGTWERLGIVLFMGWIAVLAITLLKQPTEQRH
jgi:hypothetical protein